MSTLHVVFKVAEGEYALPASSVLQMESYQGATRVPGTPPWVTGLVHLRGHVVPVVDLRARFGLPSEEPSIDSRIVVVQDGERTVGLLVDSAREVLDIAPEALRPPPDVLSPDGGGIVSSVAQVERRSGEKSLVMLVDFRKIIGEG